MGLLLRPFEIVDAQRVRRAERQAIAARLRVEADCEDERVKFDIESDLPREAREYAAHILRRLADELDRDDG